MIRILHAADLHLDSPFESLPEEKAALRRSEQRALLRSLAQLRAETEAELVLLSGDLFDSDSTWAETEELLRLTLSEMAVPVFIAPGNHDYYAANGRWARMRLPENVHVFTSADFDAVVLEELNVRVWGAAFTDNYSEAKLDTLRIPRQDGFTELVCVHGEVGNPGSRYDPIDERDIAASGADYIALGHVHACSGLKKAGKTYYAWPGCPEGRGFDECGEKGILQIDIDGETVKAGFIPTAARRYEKLRVEPGADALAAIRAALPKDTADDVYKIILTGESFAAPDLAYLRQALERDFFALTFSDETVPPRDLWRRAGEDSLAGRFLRRMQRRIEAAQTEEEKKLLLRAVRCGIAALEGWEVRL